jgi:hypothetical protein
VNQLTQSMQDPTEQAAKVTPFAAGNEGVVRKSAGPKATFAK